MKTRLMLLLTALALSACFPLRPGSEAQATDIAAGATMGYRQGLVDAQLTAQAMDTVTPVGQIQPTIPAPQALSTAAVLVVTATPIPTPLFPPTPEPTELPDPWFWVTTTNKGWFSLFDQPGWTIQQSGNRTAMIGPNRVIPAYERASGSKYYMVVVEAWIELQDLEVEVPNAWKPAKCYDHNWDHSNVLCHAHLFSSANPSPEALIGWVKQGTYVRVVEVDEYAKMAYVQLPPLWIDRAFTVR